MIDAKSCKCNINSTKPPLDEILYWRYFVLDHLQLDSRAYRYCQMKYSGITNSCVTRGYTFFPLTIVPFKC